MAAVTECLLLQLLLVVFIPVPSIFSLPVENHLDDGSLGKRYAFMKGIWQKENCFFPSAELYRDTVSVPSDGLGGILSADQPRDTGIGLRACSVDQTSDDNLSFRSTLCGTFFNLSQQFCHELKKPDRETEMEYLSLSKLRQLVKEKGLLPLCNETKKVSERLRILIMKPVFQIEDSCGQCAEDEELGQVCSILFSSILNYVEARRKKQEAADRQAAARTGISGTGAEAAADQGNEAGAAGSGVASQGGGGPGGDKLPDGEGRPPMEGGGPADGTSRPQAGADRSGAGTDRSGAGTDRSGAGDGRSGAGDDRLGAGTDRLGAGTDRSGTDRSGAGTDRSEAGDDRSGGVGGSAEGRGSPAGLGEEGHLGEEAGRQTSPEGKGQPPGANPALTAFGSAAGGPGDRPLVDTQYPGGKLLVDTNNGGASLNTMTGGSSSVLNANERGGLSQPTELAQPPGDGPGKTGGQNFRGAGGEAVQSNNNGFLEDGAGRVGGGAGDPVLTRPGDLRAPDALNTLGAQQGNGNVLSRYDRPVDQNHQGQQGGGSVGDGVGNGDGRGNIGDSVGNGGDGGGNVGDGVGITAGKPAPGQGLPGNSSPWSTEGRPDNEVDREEEDDEDFWEKANGNQGVLGDGRGQDVEAPVRKPPAQKVPDIPPDGVQSLGNALQHPYEESSPSGHFMAYFITAVILCVAGYVIYHNKQKIFAIALEGRRDGQRRRPASGSESSSSAKYSKLQSTVEEVVPALEKSTSSKNYIY